MPSKLEKALRRQDRDKLDRKTELAGTMGVVLNGVATVEVPNRAGFVYVLLNTKEQELIQAFNDKVSGLFGLAVIVVWNVNRYEVLRKDDLRYGTFNSNYLPKHGNQHSFNPDGGGGGDVTFIYGKQFVPLSLTPSGTFGAPVAIVAPYSQLNSGWHYIPSTPTPNITAHKPTDNQARMVLVAMDWNTRTTQLIIGTGTFAANLTGSADVIPYLPSPTGVMQIPIAGVRLVSGTSAVTWQNIYDVRQFFHPIFTGTSSGGGGGTGTASSTSFAVFGNTISPNDSVTNTSTVDPLTLGDTFFNDSNICTLSGNTLTFNVAGWFRIHTTIYATTLTTFGNGKIYAFVDTTAASPAWVPDYDYLTAADSSKNQIDFDFDGTIEVVEGDTITIGVTNQTGGNIFASVLEVRIETLAGGAGSVTINRSSSPGVVAWDEGIFLGTGTVFNFVGENVQASISGSVVRVFVTGSTGGGGGTWGGIGGTLSNQTDLQAELDKKVNRRMAVWQSYPNNGGTPGSLMTWGGVSNVGTTTHVDDANFGYMMNFTNGTTSGSPAGRFQPQGLFQIENSHFRGGWWTYGRCGVVDKAGTYMYFGLASGNVISSSGNSDDPSGAEYCLIQFSPTRDTNWQVITKGTGTQHVTDTSVPVTSNHVYDFYLICNPGGSSVFWEIDDLTSHTSTTGTESNDLPRANTGLKAQFGNVNQSGGGAKNTRWGVVWFEPASIETL